MHIYFRTYIQFLVEVLHLSHARNSRQLTQQKQKTKRLLPTHWSNPLRHARIHPPRRHHHQRLEVRDERPVRFRQVGWEEAFLSGRTLTEKQHREKKTVLERLENINRPRKIV